ncbi:MAG: flagellar export chaperone FliS [Terriglobales bacterium]
MTHQQSYREQMVQGASPVGLVVRLYEQIVEDLRRAGMAIESNDIMLRTRKIQHAILVIGHLQSPLDFVNGGKVARDLDHFYNVLRQNLIQVQFHPSKQALCQQITDVLALREAWIKVEQAENPSSSAAAAPPSSPSSRGFYSDADDPAADSARSHLNWRG